MLDLKGVFKSRDLDDDDRDFCVYIWKLKNNCFYIGEGRWREEDWQKGRPFHINQKDLLSLNLDARWECVVLANGLTKKEACVLEAYLLNIVERPFTKRGSYTWDGVSLINKQHECFYKGVSYDILAEQFLNLDGNYCWEIIRREINGY